jgi:GntR family transcriptional regulator
VSALSLAVDRTTPIPLHYQLRQQLRALIQHGALAPGTLLPSELQLMQRAGVSRYTVRQALDDLVREGLLVRQRGRGTVVAEPPLAQKLDHVYSFARDVAAQGRRPSSRLLSFRRHRTSADLGALFGLSARERVVEVVRLRLLDGEPVIFETNRLPERAVPGLTRGDVEGGSLYELLERRYGLRVDRAEEVVRAILLDAATAGALTATAGAAGFAVDRTAFVGGKAIERRQSVIRGDRYAFHIRLPQPQLQAD